MATNYGVISTGVTLHLRADSLSLYSCYRVIRGINASVKLLGMYAACFKCLNEERYSFTLTPIHLLQGFVFAVVQCFSNILDYV